MSLLRSVPNRHIWNEEEQADPCVMEGEVTWGTESLGKLKFSSLLTCQFAIVMPTVRKYTLDVEHPAKFLLYFVASD
jgi:hypothetical protein